MSPRDWDHEALTLVSLDHAYDPENEAHKAEDNEQGETDAEFATPVTKTKWAAEGPSEAEDAGDDQADDVESAEGDDGLRCMEAHVGATIDEEEDDAGNPSQYVA